MLIRVILTVLAVFVAVPLEAHEDDAVTVRDWHQILDGQATDDDSLLNLSTSFSKDSTALLNGGNRAVGLRKGLISLVLTKHTYARKERAGEPVSRRHVDATDQLQAAMIEAGLPDIVMDESAANLASVLREPATAMAIKRRARPRPATQEERRAMIAAIKKSLIDPTSPIYGQADVVGNQACFTVNAKNRLGGYTGDQEAVLYFNPRTRAWTAGGTINYPHGVCLDSAQ